MFLPKCHVVAMLIATTFFVGPLAAAPFAYISNQLGNSVSIIDTELGKVVDTISVQGKPAGVAVAPAGDKVYISTPEAKGFAVLDVKTRTIIAEVPVSEGACGC